MFQGLDDIDWAAMQHAYGSAADVPDLLRVVAADGGAAFDALLELCQSICHQGTVYEASALAVPFLVEVAAVADLTLMHRQMLLSLVFDIGRGRGFWQGSSRSASDGAPDDLAARLAAEERVVETCRAAVTATAETLIGRIVEVPIALFFCVASLVLVAREPALVEQLQSAPQPLEPFEDVALAAFADLVEHGHITAEVVADLAALADSTGMMLEHRPAGSPRDIPLDDPFVQNLVTHLSFADDGA